MRAHQIICNKFQIFFPFFMASNTSMELGKLVYGEEEEDMELGIGSLGWNSISSPPRIGECLVFAVYVLYDYVF